MENINETTSFVHAFLFLEIDLWYVIRKDVDWEQETKLAVAFPVYVYFSYAVGSFFIDVGFYKLLTNSNMGISDGHT